MKSSHAVLLSVLLSLAGGCASPEARPILGVDVAKPDFFPILPWDPLHGWAGRCQPGLERTNALVGIADCHFNFAGFVLPRDLPQCRALGLGAILLPTDPAFTNVNYIYEWKNLSDAQIDARVKSLVQGGGHDPSIAGYFINDEPGAPEFAALGKAVAAVKKYAPGKMAYINLFPDNATLGAPNTSQLGTPDYHTYLERFVAEVHPQFISYDNYMVQYSMDLQNPGVAASYFNNLLAVRAVGLEHHLPYLNIVASSQLRADKPIPSLDNLLFQAYTTLAAGYRGVTWYTYFGQYYGAAPIDQSGRKTPTWAALQEVNRQVALLRPILARLTSTGIFFTAPAPVAGPPLLPGTVVGSVTSATPLMVGEFQDEQGARFAMLVNLSVERTTWVTVKSTQPGARIELFSSADASLQPYETAKGIWLTAGQGVLLSVKN